MGETTMEFGQRIASGQRVLIAEVSPPTGADADRVRASARGFAGKVDALAISDNRDRVTMSAVAAAAISLAEGVEPIVHMVTRDRNRIALLSDCLGAQALGIRTILCTSGTHQTLGRFRNARNVFDLDSTQFLETLARLPADGRVVGEEGFEETTRFCLGATAAPDADPLPLQVTRTAKKAAAGAQFLVTAPIFDIDRFRQWWDAMSERGVPDKVAIIAGLEIIASPADVTACADPRHGARLPESLARRLAGAGTNGSLRDEGVKVAREIAEQLTALPGIRGLAVSGADADAVAQAAETLRDTL